MWRTSFVLTSIAVFTVLQSPAAPAAELPEAIARCADVADNLERLTCYDRQNPPRRAGATPASPDADFGANPDVVRKRQTEGTTGQPREPDRITAKVTKISASTSGDTLIMLENGQVWQQTQSRLESIANEGDEVTISRGALGSFYLVSKSRLSTRVKRVK